MGELQSYSLEHCRKHCSKAAMDWTEIYQDLEQALKKLDPKEKFKDFKYHHIPKIALAGCPNGCSRPQIKDIGVIGYVTPQFSDNECSGCQMCISVCQENAVSWLEDGIVINPQLCVSCGECIHCCPTEKIISKESGWSLYLGGHLGRHPQFAKNVGKVTSGEEMKDWILGIIEGYISEGLPEERLGHFLKRNYLST